MKNLIPVTVYCDSTDLYTEDEIMRENLCELDFPEEIVREWVWLTAAPGEIERLSNNENGYDWFDQWYYEESTADDTDGLYDFAISRYGYLAPREGVWGQTEVCPHCEAENWFAFWDVDKNGFVAVCDHCGEEIFLCDACMHHEDNPEMKCDWCQLADGGKCFRGRTKTRN